MSSTIFRLVVFLLLVVGGYLYARRIRSNRISQTLVFVLLALIVGVFILLSKKLFGLFSFSVFFILIVGGFMIGILAGLRNKNKPGS
jgi:hypothetical protein